MEFGAGVLARPKRDPYAYFEGGELPGADGAAEPLVPKRKEAGRRRRRDGSSVCGTFVNTLKCTVGAGILSLPYGFARAGWLGGTVAFLLVSVPAVYCLNRMGAVRLMILEDRIRAEKTSGLRADPGVTRHEVRKLALASRDYLEYHDLAEYAVGSRLRRLVAFMVLLGQLGTCAAYVIFMANNLMQISALFPALTSVPRFVHCLVLLPFLVLLSFVRTLRGLFPFAVFGLAVLLAGLTLVGVHGVSMAAEQNRPLQLPPMFTGDGIAVFIGMALFSFESVNAMPSLQASMTKPARFPFVLNSVMFLILLFYVGVGLGGAVLYGQSTRSTITQNMVGAGAMGHAASVLFVATLLVSFPFMMFPAAVIAERMLGGTSAEGLPAGADDDVDSFI